MYRAALALFLSTMAASSAIAAEDCKSAQMTRSEREINRMMAVLIDNAPLECKILRTSTKGSTCDVMCISTYTMTDTQHRSVQVYLAGAVGREANKNGVAKFSSITFLDRSLAKRGYGLRISAAEAARLQKLASEDKMDAEHLVSSILRSFSRVSTK
jgi:hypothetical protein